MKRQEECKSHGNAHFQKARQIKASVFAHLAEVEINLNWRIAVPVLSGR